MVGVQSDVSKLDECRNDLHAYLSLLPVNLSEGRRHLHTPHHLTTPTTPPTFYLLRSLFISNSTPPHNLQHPLSHSLLVHSSLPMPSSGSFMSQ